MTSTYPSARITSATRSTSSTAATSSARFPPRHPPPPTPPPIKPPTSAPRNPPCRSASSRSAPPAAAARPATRCCEPGSDPAGVSTPLVSRPQRRHHPMSQPRWLALAWGDLGVAETPGADHTRRVVRYYADVGHAQITNDETAWCAAFLGSCLERAGHCQHPLADGALLSWLGRAARRIPYRRHRRAQPHRRSNARSRRLPDRRDRRPRHPARRQPERCRHRRGLPPLPPPRPALAFTCHPGRRASAYPRTQGPRTPTSTAPSPTCSKWKAAGPTTPTIPAAPPTSASRSPPTPATKASSSPPPTWRPSIRAQIDFLRHGAPHLSRALLAARILPATVRAARLLPLRRRRQPGRHRRRAPAAGGSWRRDRRRDRPGDSRQGPPHARSPKRSRTTPRRAAGTTAHSPSSGVSARAGSPASTARSPLPR